MASLSLSVPVCKVGGARVWQGHVGMWGVSHCRPELLLPGMLGPPFAVTCQAPGGFSDLEQRQSCLQMAASGAESDYMMPDGFRETSDWTEKLSPHRAASPNAISQGNFGQSDGR